MVKKFTPAPNSQDGPCRCVEYASTSWEERGAREKAINNQCVRTCCWEPFRWEHYLWVRAREMLALHLSIRAPWQAEYRPQTTRACRQTHRTGATQSLGDLILIDPTQIALWLKLDALICGFCRGSWVILFALPIFHSRSFSCSRTNGLFA